MYPGSLLFLFAILLGAGLGAGESWGNLLRNGSFEGGWRYWYHEGTTQNLRDGDAAEGGSHLRLDSGFIWSGSFRLKPGTTVTISAAVRARADKAQVRFFLVPNSRNAGVEPFRLFWGKSGVGSEVSERSWKRLSWTMHIPGPDFVWADQTWWDRQGWFLFPSGDNVDIDAITVSDAGRGVDAYVGEDAVEVATLPTALPDPLATFHLLDPGTPMAMQSRLHNPGTQPVALRWQHQVVDYTGSTVLKEVASGQATLAPGETRVETWAAPIAAKGLILARTVVSDATGRRLGASDQPLSSLAFPKPSTRKPDPAERFGYSLCDVKAPPWTHIYDVLARVGFAWSRWHPHTGWNSIQPTGPEQWNWPDTVLDDLEQRGCSYNITLNGIPDWAKGSHPYLPKDMQEWGADDPRWKDLGNVTAWDRFLRAAAQRWGNGKRSVVWEIINEPLWEKWDARLYTRFIERSSRLIKSVDPKARIMVNGCYGLDELHKGFLAEGGAPAVDLFSFHNYGASGWFTTGDAVRGMRESFKAGGHEVEVWFNEGWTHWPSSEDTRAYALFAGRSPVQVAHEALCCTADAISGGLKQVILFNTSRRGPSRSWWDWGGDGNQLWDDAGQPTVAVGLFNVMADQLGLADPVATVRADKAIIHIFDDRRNRRGVAVAWASDAGGAELLLAAPGLQIMDAMGNASTLPAKPGGSLLSLREQNRPWYIFAPGLSGAKLAAIFKNHEKPNVLISQGVYGLPQDWSSASKDGCTYRFNGKPIWRAGRVFPADLTTAANYRDLPQWVPAEGRWTDSQNSQGGHPGVAVTLPITMSTIAPWQGGDSTKPCSLSFIAPSAGTWEIDAQLTSHRWTGEGQTWVQIVALIRPQAGKDGTVRILQRIDLAQDKTSKVGTEAKLVAGEELALVYGVDGMFTGAQVTIERLTVRMAVGGIDQNRPAR